MGARIHQPSGPRGSLTTNCRDMASGPLFGSGGGDDGFGRGAAALGQALRGVEHVGIVEAGIDAADARRRVTPAGGPS